MAKARSGLWSRIRSTIGGEQPAQEQPVITIVSGLPRSGTSMMMKMLEAGGVPPLTDKIRTPDDDNPEGYYEFERVKKLPQGDGAWLPEAQGKAVKVIAALLKHLPPDYHYKVIFMLRNMDEILRSQKQMLVRRGEATDMVDDEELAILFAKHVEQTKAWLGEQAHFDVIFASYNDIVSDPRAQVQRINAFLGGTLSTDGMMSIVDPNLYRQRE